MFRKLILKVSLGAFVGVFGTVALGGDGALPFGRWLGKGTVYDAQWNIINTYTSTWVRTRNGSGKIHSQYHASYTNGQTWSLECDETVTGAHVDGTCDGGTNKYFCADPDFCKGTFEEAGSTNSSIGEFTRLSSQMIRKSAVKVGANGTEWFIIENFSTP